MTGSALLSRIDAGDRAVFARCAGWQPSSRWGRRAWRLVTNLGGASSTIALALAPMLAGDEARRVAWNAFLTLAISHALVQLAKRTIGRRRPSHAGIDALVCEPDRFSFPSGHAAAAMSLAFVYAMSVPWMAPVVLALAALVGLSRVVLGVHYVSDVVVGQALAVLTGAMVLGR